MRRIRRPLLTVIAFAVTVASVAFLPWLVGSSWQETRRSLLAVSPAMLTLLAALWLLGLASYAVAMVASLPGLTYRQAIALNLAGSSAANLLPFGGVVGTAINLAMTRSWGLSTRRFASSTAVLNLLNLASKLVVGLAGMALVVMFGGMTGGTAVAIGSAVGAGVIVLAACGLAVWKPTVARRLDRWLGLLLPPRVRPGLVEQLRRDVRSGARDNWRALLTGTVGYLVIQYLLFAACLNVVGVDPLAAGYASIAAFAIERLATLAVITPAGAGLAELSAAAVMTALGVAPTAAVASVVLYRLFVFVAEIPVGASVLLGWALQSGSAIRRPGIPSKATMTPTR